jgi:hypothetical protein
MESRVRIYNPVVTLSRAEAVRASYMGLRSWAVEGMAQARATTRPFRTYPVAVQESIIDTVSIMAACMLSAPLGKMEIMETCGRIALVAMEEYGIARGLIVPLSLVNLGGEYNSALAEYAQHVSKYVRDQRWWNKARVKCDDLLCALEKVACVLTAEELSYLVVKIQVLLAWPQGREAMSKV